MAITAGKTTITLLAAIADAEPREIGTLTIPVTAELRRTRDGAEVRLDTPAYRRQLKRALSQAARAV